MQTILDILKEAGGWNPGLSLRIENMPFRGLTIEAVDEPGPCGLPALSVAHYGKQNGDLMRDPEMLFELEPSGELNPFYWRNDYIGTVEWSRFRYDTGSRSHRSLYLQHVSFARTWDRNLFAKSFAQAFRRQQHGRR